MLIDYNNLYDRLQAQARQYGIQVQHAPLGAEEAGKFDGPTITMNVRYDSAERCYYLVHAVGSIVAWSLDRPSCLALFDELWAAKKHKAEDSARLERAIERYRAFEIATSEYAVWLLAEAGHSEAVSPYTNFMRADLEALTIFHRTGRAPVWREFFTQWNRDVAEGRQEVIPFTPRPVPSFRPVAIPTQEVLQEKDGRPNE